MARSLNIKTAGSKVGRFMKNLFWDGFGPKGPKVTVAEGDLPERKKPELTRKEKRFLRKFRQQEHLERVGHAPSTRRGKKMVNSRKRRRDRVRAARIASDMDLILEVGEAYAHAGFGERRTTDEGQVERAWPQEKA